MVSGGNSLTISPIFIRDSRVYLLVHVVCKAKKGLVSGIFRMSVDRKHDSKKYNELKQPKPLTNIYVWYLPVSLSKLACYLRYPSSVINPFSWTVGDLLGKYQFGTDCSIHPFCRLENPSNIEVGDGTYLRNHAVIKAKQPDGIKIGENCSVNEFTLLAGNISIGNGVRIANNVSMHSYNHRINPEEMVHTQSLDHGRINIENDVWIGSGVRILKDVCIGEGAVIGAGAVVTRDVEPYDIVVGNPATKIGER